MWLERMDQNLAFLHYLETCILDIKKKKKIAQTLLSNKPKPKPMLPKRSGGLNTADVKYNEYFWHPLTHEASTIGHQ